MSRFPIPVALLAAFAIAAPMAQAERSVVMHITVPYGDLKLESRQGIATLFKRIEHAAAKVCGGRPKTMVGGAMTRFRTCRDASMADGVRQIDNPTVQLAWMERNGKSIRTASR